MEVQLRVLEKCVIAKDPIIDYGPQALPYWFQSGFHKKPEPRGQDELALNIIYTCRTYREEGWKLFWKRNTFVSTNPQGYHFTYSPAVSGLIHHLSLRYLYVDKHEVVISSMFHALDLCGPFKNLKTLEIHLVSPSDEPCFAVPTYYHPIHGRFLKKIRNAYHRNQKTSSSVSTITSRSSHHPGNGTHIPLDSQTSSTKGMLKKILITGLPEDEVLFDILALRLLSSKLESRGQVGITVGIQNRHYSYHFRSMEFSVSTEKPEPIWIKADECEKWIDDHAATFPPPSPVSGLIDWEKLKLHKSSRFFRCWA